VQKGSFVGGELSGGEETLRTLGQS